MNQEEHGTKGYGKLHCSQNGSISMSVCVVNPDKFFIMSADEDLIASSDWRVAIKDAVLHHGFGNTLRLLEALWDVLMGGQTYALCRDETVRNAQASDERH